MDKIIRTIVLGIFASLTGCGGGSSSNTTPDESSGTTIDVFYTKGPVSGATAILLDTNGNTVAGPVSTVNGQASFPNVTFSGPVYARFSGGSYTDEATGTVVALTENFVIRSGIITNPASASSNPLKLTATPLTEIGFQRAIAAATGGNVNPVEVNAFIDEVADEFGLDNIDLSTVLPTPLTEISGNSTGDQYGAVLAAISQQISTATGSTSAATDAGLAQFISGSLGNVDQTAFGNAVNDLLTNTNTGSFINTQVVNGIACIFW